MPNLRGLAWAQGFADVHEVWTMLGVVGVQFGQVNPAPPGGDTHWLTTATNLAGFHMVFNMSGVFKFLIEKFYWGF